MVLNDNLEGTNTIKKEVNGNVLEVPNLDSKVLDVKIGTKLRLVFLVAAYIITACDTIGAFDLFIPEKYRLVVTTISLIASAAASVAAYWFNNSWTSEATVVDKLLATIKHTSVYCPEIVDSVNASIAEFNKKTADAAKSVTAPVPLDAKKETN